jgi:hypothetical protein
MFDPELFSVIGIAALPLEQLPAEAEADPLNTGQSIVILLKVVVDAEEKSVELEVWYLKYTVVLWLKAELAKVTSEDVSAPT